MKAPVVFCLLPLGFYCTFATLKIFFNPETDFGSTKPFSEDGIFFCLFVFHNHFEKKRTFCETEIGRNIAPRLKVIWKWYSWGYEDTCLKFCRRGQFLPFGQNFCRYVHLLLGNCFWNILENYKNKSMSFMVTHSGNSSFFAQRPIRLFGFLILCKHRFHKQLTAKNT